MTPAQHRRQDMQVQWLREAIAAQNKSPDEDAFERATLRIKPKDEAQ